MVYRGSERRRSARIKGQFTVSYRVLDEHNIDVTQTKNIGQGGIWFTTNRKLSPGTKLALNISLPLYAKPVVLIGSVVESKELPGSLVYDTRLAFLSVDERQRQVIGKTLKFYSPKQKR